jgi:uncharacterized protein YbjT (DUF2867 family)
MRGKVVTVFGGSGFIGRHLIRRLAARGATIRVPTRNRESAYHLRPLGEVGQIVAMPMGYTDAALLRLTEGSDYVVNLIGILHGDFDRLQAQLPGRIAAAATEAGSSALVHLSAIGADPSSPSAYARTKAAGEKVVREAFPAAVILRPSILFGPEDKFLNKFARMSRFSPALPLIGGGKMRFQPVYVGDVADAILAGIENRVAGERRYELGGPSIYTFKELLQYLLRVLERRRALIELPWGLAEIEARFFEFLPEPPLTRDQLLLLRRDNVVTPGEQTLADLGIQPTPLEAIVPTYLTRQREHSRLSSL